MSPNKFDVNKNYYPKAPLLPALLRALCFFLFYYVTRMVIYNGAAIFFVSRYGDCKRNVLPERECDLFRFGCDHTCSACSLFLDAKKKAHKGILS